MHGFHLPRSAQIAGSQELDTLYDEIENLI
jgi:hypothetical protein